jgi:hypothetical protein
MSLNQASLNNMFVVTNLIFFSETETNNKACHVELEVLTAASMKITVFWVDAIAVMMEAVCTSETSVNFHHSTRCNNPEDSHLHTRRRENVKSHLVNLYGEATLRYVRRFEALQTKKAKPLIALMMEAASTSETSVNFYWAARRNNPKDSHLQSFPCPRLYVV